MALPTHVKTDNFGGGRTNMISFPFGKGNNRGYYFSILTWHITPKCSGLRQRTWIISQLLWSGILAQPSWVFWPQSPEGWTREGPTFQLMQLLVGFHSSFLRLRAAVLLWLSGRGSLTHGLRTHVNVYHQSLQAKKTTEVVYYQGGRHILLLWPHHLWVSYSLEGSLQAPCTHKGEELHKGMNTKEVGIARAILEAAHRPTSWDWQEYSNR